MMEKMDHSKGRLYVEFEAGKGATMTVADRVATGMSVEDYRTLMAEVVERLAIAGIFTEADLRRLHVLYSTEGLVLEGVLEEEPYPCKTVAEELELVIQDAFGIPVTTGATPVGHFYASVKGLEDASVKGLLKSVTAFDTTEEGAVQELWRRLTHADRLVLGARTDDRAEFRWNGRKFERLETRG